MGTRIKLAAGGIAVVALAVIGIAILLAGEEQNVGGGSGEEATEVLEAPQRESASALVDPLDLRTIQALKDTGSDLSRRTDVIHYLYFQTEQDARGARRELRALGFQVQASPPDDRLREWSLSAFRDMIVSIKTITSTRLVLADLAARYQGEYDGWEARVQ